MRKTTRPTRCNLNQPPYEYAVEVTNRLKRLDLVDRLPEEPWTEVHNTVQKAVNKTIPKKKKNKKAKWLPKEDLQIAKERTAQRNKKAFSEQCMKLERNKDRHNKGHKC